MIKSFLLLLMVVLLGHAVLAQELPKPTQEVLDNAFDKAKAENKNVFIIFHASWCGWCKKMDNAMKDPACSSFFDKNYVVSHLTILETEKMKHLENPGAEALFKNYAPENSGIPFWMVFDGKTKKLIGDAKMPDDTNSGCPAAPSEVAHFLAVLKKSSQLDSLSASRIADRFRQNAMNR